MNIHVQVLSGHMFSVLLGIYLRVGLLGHMISLYLAFEELLNGFPKWLHQFTFLPALRVAISLHPYQHLLLSVFLIIAILVDIK